MNLFTNWLHRLKRHPSKGLRITAGMLLIILGLLGFLPVLGFWMIPFGLVLLSVDFHWARRARRKLEIYWGRLRNRYKRVHSRRG